MKISRIEYVPPGAQSPHWEEVAYAIFHATDHHARGCLPPHRCGSEYGCSAPVARERLLRTRPLGDEEVRRRGLRTDDPRLAQTGSIPGDARGMEW